MDFYQRHQLALMKTNGELADLIMKQDQAETRDQRLRYGIMLKCYAQLLGGLALEMHNRIFEEEGVRHGENQAKKLQTVSRPG